MYSLIYGSIGTIIVLLVWLYVSATVIIMGAEFNSVLAELRSVGAAWKLPE
jgi:membrane protein